MRVDTREKVRRLNADLLDGLGSTAFLRATSKAVDADLFDGQDSSLFAPALCPNGPDEFVLALTDCTRVIEITAPIVQSIPIRIGYSAPVGVAGCPLNMYAIGGGYNLAGPSERLDTVRASFPTRFRYQPETWVVEVAPNVANGGVVTPGSTVHVVCIGPVELPVGFQDVN